VKLEHRSYNSRQFRPKPHIHTEADGSLVVIATSWGLPEHAALAAEEVAKYASAARGDVEVTSPFEVLTCLSDDANHLRIGMMIANDLLYRRENRTEYVSGLEILAISRRGPQISWAQVGAPHVLLRRPGRPLVPLALSYDHSFEIVASSARLAPLPSRLLGTDPTCHIHCGDLRIGREDVLVLASSSLLPSSLWTEAGPYDLARVTREMMTLDPESPFWLGLVDFRD
jgi:hypothetical protein